MDKLKQLFWLLIFSYLGEILSLIISRFVTIPGSVIGMVILFLALHFNILPIEKVDDVGTWLTDNMAFLFVPAGVGLMTQFEVLGGNVWWQLLIILFVTTALMMWCVGTVVQKQIDKRQNKGAKK
ncbi:CidA/LrgA family protein [Aerococcaceae bacterium INB8]|uniref:CidA/LrgA family protein n=1 Tax=Ruoffia halotolerans TaxID=2748684 RepID=A0A839A3Q4_9LACT|nr:CidA/LrgA family protein [Ruoffia halotolerans]MBA5728856.1 CidA/LrgA family protein [Ruoffia halotolerans]